MIANEVIQLLKNRLAYQRQQRAMAEQRGDIAAINQIDADIAEAERTLAVLQEAT
jgi:hypothetical protein